MNLDEVFSAIARWGSTAPGVEALAQVRGRRLTYARLADELDLVTAALQEAGLRPGDAVVFSVRPSIEAIVLILAIVRCGGIVVAADPGMSPELFAARTAALRPRWVMTESALYAMGRLQPVRAWLERRGVRLPNFDVPGSRLVLSGRWPVPRHAIRYAELASRRARDLRPSDAGASAFVVFTSGSTGAPRGVLHTAASLGASLGLISEQLQLRPGDRVYSDQLHMLIPALIAGASAIIPRRDETVRDLERIRPTHVYWAPANADRIMRGAARLHQGLPDSLRVVLLGSAPVTVAFMRRLDSALPSTARVYAAYAMTEMLPVSWVAMEEKLGYDGPGDLLGTPCQGVEVRIAPDGEIFLRGPNLCARYLGCPPLAELATGDVGFVRGGRLVLLGRKKDMIIRGDHNIYPQAVEEVAAAVPGVRRTAMVGVQREPVADEVVVLAIEPEPGMESSGVERRVRRELWSGPRRIDIDARPDHILVTDIPVAGRSNKIDREALREAVRRRLRC